MLARRPTFENLWVFEAGLSTHQLRSVYDTGIDTVCLLLDHDVVGDVLGPNRWREGQSITFDVAGSPVVVSVRLKRVAVIPWGIDVPVVRVWVDGRPLVSQDARELAIASAMIALPLPIGIGIISIALLPRPAVVPGLVLVGTAAIGWVIGIAWGARRWWFESAPLGYTRYQAIPSSLFAFAALLLVAEVATFGLLAAIVR